MKCPKCKSGKHTFSNWLPDGQNLKDFIRWKELAVVVVMCVICLCLFGILGLVVAYILDSALSRSGGLQTMTGAPSKPKIEHTGSKECLKGKHTFCIKTWI